jgi:hypothetical protein
MVGWGRRLNLNGMGRLEMLKQLTLGAAIVAGALLLTPASTPASAAPLAPAHSGVADGDNLAQEVHWRHRRHYRRHYRRYNYDYDYNWGYYYRPYYYQPYYYDDDWRWRWRHRHHRHHHRHW